MLTEKVGSEQGADVAAAHLDSSEAHHMVAGTDRRAGEARAALERFEIDINSADNGVFLPANLGTPNAEGLAVHRAVHTDAYFRAVNALLGQATTRGEVLEALAYVRSRLLSGGFP